MGTLKINGNILESGTNTSLTVIKTWATSSNGLYNNTNFNVDTPSYNLGKYQVGTVSGTLPDMSKMGGANQVYIISAVTGDYEYNAQLAFSFGSSQCIALRSRWGKAWKEWHYFTTT